MVAERGGKIVGWVSGYRPPSRPSCFFVWQVAVATGARGEGLARRMITALLAWVPAHDVTHVVTTVTAENQASWALFERLAQDWGAPLEKTCLFDRDVHFAGAHASEWQASIGPLPSGA